MIKVLYTNGKYSPVIRCDLCGERVSNARLGAVLRRTPQLAEGEESEVVHVHKGQCHDTMERQLGGSPGWEEMSAHMMYLLLNTGTSPAELAKVQKTYEEMGMV